MSAHLARLQACWAGTVLILQGISSKAVMW